MSTSGSTSWTLQNQAVCNAALRKLAVLSGGSIPQSYELTNAMEALNAMVKGFHADGMPVWAMAQYVFTTIVGQAQYSIGIGQQLNTPAPLKIVQATRTESMGGENIPMNIYTQYNYNILPLVNTSGVPINLYYQPFQETGTINLWPIPGDNTTQIKIMYQRPFDDMVNNTDDFDFPPYWTEAIIWGLAWRLSGEYGLPIMDRQNLMKEADFFHQQALSFGSEEGSMYLMPDWSGRRT